MRYGFYLPTRGETATPEALEALLGRGEALGFSSVVIADHIVFPANPAAPLRPAELRLLLEELYRLTEAEQRDPSKLTISYKAPLYDSDQGVDGGNERRPFSGSPQAIADDIATFARLGVSELIFDFRSESLRESLERMERFAPIIRQTVSA